MPLQLPVPTVSTSTWPWVSHSGRPEGPGSREDLLGWGDICLLLAYEDFTQLSGKRPGVGVQPARHPHEVVGTQTLGCEEPTQVP